MNPLERGSQAIVGECRARLGGPFVFARAYEAMVGALHAGANYRDPAAMTALHAAVIKWPPIEASTSDIFGAIAGFKSGVHYHGPDAHFLAACTTMVPMHTSIPEESGMRKAYGRSWKDH